MICYVDLHTPPPPPSHQDPAYTATLSPPICLWRQGQCPYVYTAPMVRLGPQPLPCPSIKYLPLPMDPIPIFLLLRSLVTVRKDPIIGHLHNVLKHDCLVSDTWFPTDWLLLTLPYNSALESSPRSTCVSFSTCKFFGVGGWGIMVRYADTPLDNLWEFSCLHLSNIWTSLSFTVQPLVSLHPKYENKVVSTGCYAHPSSQKSALDPDVLSTKPTHNIPQNNTIIHLFIWNC